MLAKATSSWPDAIAVKANSEMNDNSPESVSSVATPESSTRTKAITGFDNLRARAFDGR